YAVSHGSSEWFWNTTARSGPGPFTSLPSRITPPELHCASPAITYPILWERVCRNPHRPEIVVVDPRATETAQAATHHYGIAPKSDLAFFYGLANLLIQRGAVERAFVAAHTSGYEAFAAFVA